MRALMKRALVLFIVLLSGCASVPAPRPVHIVIVGTTDVHGWFAGRKLDNLQVGGLPLFGSYVEALRAQNGGRVVLVDSGDLFQGTLESNYFEGEPIVRAYDQLGYAAAAIGNHEFDYGPVGPNSVVRAAGEDPFGALKKNAAEAKFPFLSANMSDKTTGQTPPWAKRSTIVDSGGVRIGIIGLSTPDTPNVTVRSNVVSLEFTDPVAATISAARELRAQGADAVIVIAHMGGKCTDLEDVHDVGSCDDQQEAMQYLGHLPRGTIDAYFAGHTHSQMRQFVNGVPALQGAAYSVEFSAVDLWIDPVRHRVDTSKTTLRPLTMICGSVFAGTDRCDPRQAPKGAALVPATFAGRAIEPDRAVTAALSPYLEAVAAKRNEPLGIRSAAPFRRDYAMESPLGNLLADALRAAFHTDMAFMNSGGIRTNLRAGDLVYGDLFEVSPFDNYPAIVTMTGAEITEALRLSTLGERGIMQVSGVRYTFDAKKDSDKPPAERNRVLSVTLDDGTPIDPNKTYTVAMPDFIATGGDGLLPVTGTIPPERFRFDQNETVHDVLIDVLRTFPQPLVPKVEGRITVLNAQPHEH